MILYFTLLATSKSLQYDRKDLSGCLISQYGVDGFGHQLEGKLSCMIAAEINPNFTYIHRPFKSMEHGTHSGEAERFSGNGTGFIRHEELNFNFTFQEKTPPVFILQAAVNQSKDIRCNDTTIYTTDNCWEYIYVPPAVFQLENLTIRNKLRYMYYSTPKPNTGFDPSKKNIAVHVRFRAKDRLLSLQYYKRGFSFYRDMYHDPVFWILADDPNWHGHEALKASMPKGHVHVPSKDSSLFTDFHRMVAADGLIMSHSSLSSAAALLSNASRIVGFRPGSRGKWFESSTRFMVFGRN